MASPGPDSDAGRPAGVWIHDIHFGHDMSVQRAPDMSPGLSAMLDSPNETLETSLPAPQSEHVAHWSESPFPIFRLPVELLVLVFMDVIMSAQAYYGSHRGRPLNLGLVCRQWRDLVVHTPYLWSTVDYTIRELPTPEAEERVLASLRLHIERSSRLPLDVSINLSTTPRQKESDFWPTISTLFRRASAFRFSTGIAELAVLTSQVLRQHAPVLKHFTFYDADYDIELSELELALDAPLLQFIECQGPPVRFTLQSYPSVRDVRLHSLRDGPSHLIDQIRRFPNVVDLDITCYDRDLGAVVQTPMVLARLKTLRIDGIDGFLTHDDIAQCFSCPSLCSAKISGTCDEDDGVLLIVPRAVTLFMQSALRTVRTLTLDLEVMFESSDCDIAPAVIEGLYSCTHLQHLALHIHAGVGVLTALSSPSLRTGETWICPCLQTISVYLSNRGLDETLGFELTDLAVARGGTGLTKIELRSDFVNDKFAHEWSSLQDTLDQLLSTSPSVISLDDSDDEIY